MVYDLCSSRLLDDLSLMGQCVVLGDRGHILQEPQAVVPGFGDLILDNNACKNSRQPSFKHCFPGSRRNTKKSGLAFAFNNSMY